MLEEHLRLAEKFHLDVTKLPMPAEPRKLGPDEINYALKVFHEEINELVDAKTVGDQADAIIDLVYFAYGRLLEMGVRPDAGFRLVHDANMKKVSGANKRGDRFEAAKPEGWQPPDWDALLGTRGKYIGLKPRKKILLLGYGRHGKDTVAELLRDRYGYQFTSSSFACAEHVMMPAFKALYEEWLAKVDAAGTMRESIVGCPPVQYATAQECFDDRHNHRAFWFQEIERYNSPDKSKLGQLIFSQNDIYVGLRSKREFSAVKIAGLYDVCVWVDASDRLPPEGTDSCTVQPWMADYVLDNNGTLEELKFNVQQLVEHVL